MGVEIFSTAAAYKEWADYTSNKEVVSVVVLYNELVVTWKFV